MATPDYSKFSNSALIEEIIKLKKRKKFGLVWENKAEAVLEKCKTHLPVLEENKKKKIKTKKNYPTNILIEGDNYEALSVLNYTHHGSIDVIYVNPPYNTGAKDWKYNNNYVNLEDPYRHTKWLSFMYHRLEIAKNLLKKNGIICVTIDDNEMPRLWCLLDELFGEKNHLGTVIIRNNPKGRKTTRKVSLIHEYAIFYGKSEFSKIQKNPIEVEKKSHKYKKDEDGSWYLPLNLRKEGADSMALQKNGKYSDRHYPIYFDPKSNKLSVNEKFEIKIFPKDSEGNQRIWRRGKEDIEWMFEEGELWYKKTKYGDQIYFKFRGGLDGEPPQSIWMDPSVSASEHGTRLLNNILGRREASISKITIRCKGMYSNCKS